MARYQIIVAYDGTGFLGSQRQSASIPERADGNRTVQSELERALRRIGWQGRSLLLAGRTDTGTHASGQVAAFDLEWPHGTDRLLAALNSALSTDLAVRAVLPVEASFHPRFSATRRTYRYRLFTDPVRDPLRERYAWRVWPAVAGLAELGPLWLGRHDFSAFGTPPRRGASAERTVYAAEWQGQASEWTFTVQADAFLYRMVRRLVYTQVACAQGRLEKDALALALTDPGAGRSLLPAGLAPACGLTLVDVRYDERNEIV